MTPDKFPMEKKHIQNTGKPQEVALQHGSTGRLWLPDPGGKSDRKKQLLLVVQKSGKLTSWYAKCPIVCKVSYMSGGFFAGFLVAISSMCTAYIYIFVHINIYIYTEHIYIYGN